MKTRAHGKRFLPQLIAERKPLRPVYVAATRRPIKVTKLISLGSATLPARRTS